MSKSVLKRCLELVEDDVAVSTTSKQTKQKANRKQKVKSSTIFDLIPEQKRLTITTKVGKSQIKRESVKKNQKKSIIIN